MTLFRILLLLIALPLYVATGHASDMQFRWVTVANGVNCAKGECAKILEASGTISSDTPQQFRQFLDWQGEEKGARRAVLLHSPGGDLTAGMRLGLEFRRLGLIVYVGRFVEVDTLVGAGLIKAGKPAAREVALFGKEHPVNGVCYSACVYSFVGGVKRIVPTTSKLGVHRPTLIKETFFGIPLFDNSKKTGWDLERIGELERVYLRVMGASPSLVALAHSVSPQTIRVLSQKELRRFGVTTR